MKLRQIVTESSYPNMSKTRSMCRTFSLVPWKTSHQRSWHNKKLSNFEKLLFCDTKIDHQFFKLPSAKWHFRRIYHSKTEICKISQLVFLERGFFWGDEKRYFTHNPGLTRLSPKELSIPLNKLPWEEILVHYHLNSLT